MNRYRVELKVYSKMYKKSTRWTTREVDANSVEEVLEHFSGSNNFTVQSIYMRVYKLNEN